MYMYIYIDVHIQYLHTIWKEMSDVNLATTARWSFAKKAWCCEKTKRACAARRLIGVARARCQTLEVVAATASTSRCNQGTSSPAPRCCEGDKTHGVLARSSNSSRFGHRDKAHGVLLRPSATTRGESDKTQVVFT